MPDTDLFLSPHEFQKLLLVKRKIESKFIVVINVPNATTISDIAVVSIDGTAENLSIAVKFLHAYIFSGNGSSFSYSRQLEMIFSQDDWINLLEKLHDVIIIRKEHQNLLIFGSGEKVALSALNELASSLNYTFDLYSPKYYFNLIDEIHQNPVASEFFKRTVFSLLDTLPLCTRITLLFWIKHCYMQVSDDSVVAVDEVCDEENHSVIILDVPKKEVVVITLSDEETEVTIESEPNNNRCLAKASTLGSTLHADESTCQKNAKNRVTRRVNPVPKRLSKNMKKRMKRKAMSKACKAAACCELTKEIEVAEKLMPVGPIPAVACNLRPIVIDGNNLGLWHRNRPYDWLHLQDKSTCQRNSKNQVTHSLNPVPKGLSKNMKKKMKRKAMSKVCEAATCCELTKEIEVAEKVMPIDPIPVVPRKLRPIVIDGNNLGIEHGRPAGVFSCSGIEICIKHFLSRGHTDVTAFVPQFRRRGSPKTVGQPILEELNKSHRVVFTPSRFVNGKPISSHHERFILELACRTKGVIVSNCRFRSLLEEKQEWKKAIEERILMYCFVGDIFMIPEDPCGRKGPKINEFLSFPNS